MADQLSREEQLRRQDEINGKTWTLLREVVPWFKHSPPETYVLPKAAPEDRPPATLESLPEELRKEITVSPEGCWLWHVTGKRFVPHSYGSAEYQGHRGPAHRLIWTLLVGEIPFRGEIDHLCEKKRCVNPAHLELVSSGMNCLRYHTRRSHRNAFLEAQRGNDRMATAIRPLNPAYGTAMCAFCGEPFAKKRGWQTFCSDHCRKEGWVRKGLEPPPPERQAALDFTSPAGWTPAQREQSAALRGRESKAQAILARLQHGPATTLELSWIGGVRFGARLLELRQQGYRIETEHRVDYAIYRLEAKP